jgi:hypothetical protein
MARRYFREALGCADLDPQTRDRIETALPDAEKQLQQSRLSGFVQGGVRHQTATCSGSPASATTTTWTTGAAIPWRRGSSATAPTSSASTTSMSGSRK